MIIYVLVDPRTRRVRYVGQTTRPAQRAAQHRTPSGTPGNEPLAKWKRKLGALGLRPLFVPVLSCATVDELDHAEVAWIRFFRAQTSELLNCDDGGQESRKGMTGKRHTAEWKARMSGRVPPNKGGKASDETRARMSAAKRGRRLPPETIRRMTEARLGHTTSAETRAKIAAAHKGLTHSTATRAKLSAQRIGIPLPDETKAKLRIAQQARRAREANARTAVVDGKDAE